MKSIRSVDIDGNIHYKNEKGVLHREDGPAFEGCYGSKTWYVNGERHREDGPAIVWSNGSVEYYYNGVLHREDGPAIIWSDGDVEYWLNEEEYSKEDWEEEVVKLKLKRIKDL